MSSSALEYPTSPSVELRVARALSPGELATLTAANASADPAESWRAGLMAYRTFAMQHAKKKLAGVTDVSETLLRRTMDEAWLHYLPTFQQTTGPMIAEAYFDAFKATESGNVPAQLIYQLAEEHAARVGKYFNDTSTEALTQGFNTYVNRQVPKRVALDRVLDAFGITPRQMSGYVSASTLNPAKMETATPKDLKGKIRAYIGRSINDRFKIFQHQEKHNLHEQSQQVAWMWMVENNRLPKETRKQWLTAKDEKVCKQCGPMHRATVKVGETFTMPNGNKIYVPGAHVNCRCVVRLQVNPFQVVKGFGVIAKADNDFDPDEHPRGRGGRFTRRVETAEAPADTRPIDPGFARLLQETKARDDAEAAAAAAATELPPLTNTQPMSRLGTGMAPLGVSTPLGQLTPLSNAPAQTAAPQVAPLTNVAAPLTTTTPLVTPPLASIGLTQEQQLQQLTLAQIQAQAAATKLATVAPVAAPTRTGVKFINTIRLPESKYHLGSGDLRDHEHADNRRAWFESTATWTGRQDATERASQNIQKAIAEKVDAIIASTTDDKNWTSFSMGEEYEYDYNTAPASYVELRNRDNTASVVVTRNALTDLVRSVAYGEDLRDVGLEGAIWMDMVTNTPLGFTNAKALAKELELDQEDFRQYIYVTDEAYDKKATQVQSASKAGTEDWLIWGDFPIVDEEEYAGDNLPITYVLLRPDREIEEFDD